MNTLPVLIANGFEDVIGFVVFIVIAVVIWTIQAFGKMARKGQPQRPQARPRGQPPAEAGVEDEIGEFLRRAAQRRQQEPGQPPQRPGERAVRAEVIGGERPVRAEVLRQRAREAARRQAAAQGASRTPPYTTPRVEAQRPADPLVVPQQPAVVPRLQPVADALRIELGDVFATAGPDTTAAASAAGLYAMLSEPRGLRQAIVLAEILSRPEDRW